MWEQKANELVEALFMDAKSANNGGIGEDSLYHRITENYRQGLRERIKKTAEYKKIGLLPDKLGMPLTAQCEVTFRCNLSCAMCYNNSGSARLNSKREKELSDEEWLAIVQDFCEKNVLEVVISGGEPFMRENLIFSMLEILKEHNVLTHFITNGTYLNEKNVSRLARYRSILGFFQVSIDGPDPTTHDRIRGVKGSWKKALRGAALVSKYGLAMRVCSCFTPDSFKKIPDMVDTAIAMGANQIVVGKVLMAGRAAEESDKFRFNTEKMEEYWRIVGKEIKTKSCYIKVSPGMDSNVQLRLHYIEPTYAVVIRPNGDIKIGCSAPFVVGNLRHNSLEEIWTRKASCGFQIPEVVQYIESIKAPQDEAEAYKKLNIEEWEDSVYLQ